MGIDDTIDRFKGREAEWAALCAFDGIKMSDEQFLPEHAPELIEALWDFVTETCEEEGVVVPTRAVAISELKKLISHSCGD